MEYPHVSIVISKIRHGYYVKAKWRNSSSHAGSSAGEHPFELKRDANYFVGYLKHEFFTGYGGKAQTITVTDRTGDSMKSKTYRRSQYRY